MAISQAKNSLFNKGDVNVYFLAGEVNMRGTAPIADLQEEYAGLNPNPNVLLWDGTKFAPLSTAVVSLYYYPPFSSSSFGPIFSLGNKLYRHTREKIYFIMQGVGGTSLETVDPGEDWDIASVGEQYDDLVAQWTAASATIAATGKTAVPTALYWLHGTTDAAVEAASLATEANTNALFDELQTDISASLQFVIATLFSPILAVDFEANVIAGQDAVIAARADTYGFGTLGLGRENDTEFNASGQDIIGERFFEQTRDNIL